MNTAITLAALLTPFALIVFAVLTRMRHSEDDDLVQRLADGLPPTEGDDLAEMFAAWVSECDAPTEPALKRDEVSS